MFVALGLLIYVFSKNLLANVLDGLKCSKRYNTRFNTNSYKTRMYMQFLPLVLLMGTFTYLVTDTISIEEKGDILFNRYYSDLENVNITDSESIEDAISRLKTIKKEFETDTYFILKKDPIINQDTNFILNKDSIIYQDNNEEISEFFITYTFFFDNINHTYGYYATGIQGAFELVDIDGEQYAVRNNV